MSLDLLAKLVKIVSKLSSLHNFIAKLSGIFNGYDVFRTSNPLLESLSKHYSVDHVSNSLKFIYLSIGGSYSHCLLSFLL
jgi:hypothetical protein